MTPPVRQELLTSERRNFRNTRRTLPDMLSPRLGFASLSLLVLSGTFHLNCGVSDRREVIVREKIIKRGKTVGVLIEKCQNVWACVNGRHVTVRPGRDPCGWGRGGERSSPEGRPSHSIPLHSLGESQETTSLSQPRAPATQQPPGSAAVAMETTVKGASRPLSPRVVLKKKKKKHTWLSCVCRAHFKLAAGAVGN